MSGIADRLEELRDRGLYRRTRLVEGPQGAQVTLDGAPVLLLCSNDYHGLAAEPRVREAAAEAARRWGAGAGAARLISGTMTPHHDLERALARFTGYERTLLFGSGYLANTGTIPVLAGRDEVVFSDELNHASIVDGCRLARAETFVYRHRDLEHLEWGLSQAGSRAALIATDGVFSMDGDIAPLPGILELARRHRCRVMVDEAHALGTVGPQGRGSVAAFGLTGEIDVVVGTLGKSFGSYGAFVAGSSELAELLLNTARTFIFSTAPPPPAAAAAYRALSILESEPERVGRLAANAQRLREGLSAEGLELGAAEGTAGSDLGAEGATAPIATVPVGDPGRTMDLCEGALERGIFAQGIRPPTVPPGTSRLRLTAMSTHRPADLDEAAAQIGAAARELGLSRLRAAA